MCHCLRDKNIKDSVPIIKSYGFELRLSWDWGDKSINAAVLIIKRYGFELRLRIEETKELMILLPQF